MALCVHRSIGDAMNSVSVLCQVFMVSRQTLCECAQRSRKSKFWVGEFGGDWLEQPFPQVRRVSSGGGGTNKLSIVCHGFSVGCQALCSSAQVCPFGESWVKWFEQPLAQLR
jgi:hypothetical protein